MKAQPMLATLLILASALACTKVTPAVRDTVTATASRIPTRAATSTPRPALLASPTIALTVSPTPVLVVVSGSWNCRESASQSADVIGHVGNGETVRLTGQVARGWTQIIIPDLDRPCWVAGY